MDHTAELVVNFISVPPEKRDDGIIGELIAWLKQVSAFMHDVEPGKHYSSCVPELPPPNFGWFFSN